MIYTMQQHHTHGADPLPLHKPAARKILGLPLPAYRLIQRLAVLKGVTMSEAAYTAFRDDLHRLEDGETWERVPAPFSIKPTYFADQAMVLVWNPYFTPLTLTGKEACSLAGAIIDACESPTPLTFKLTTERGEHRVRLSRGGSHVSLHVDDESFAMPLIIAIDVAKAIDSASVNAGPIPRREAADDCKAA